MLSLAPLCGSLSFAFPSHSHRFGTIPAREQGCSGGTHQPAPLCKAASQGRLSSGRQGRAAIRISSLSLSRSHQIALYIAFLEKLLLGRFFFFSILNLSQVSGYFESPFTQTSLGRDVSSAIPDALSAAGLCRAKRLPKRVDCHVFTPQHLAEHIPTTLCPPAQYPRLSLYSHNASF